MCLGLLRTRSFMNNANTEQKVVPWREIIFLTLTVGLIDEALLILLEGSSTTAEDLWRSVCKMWNGVNADWGPCNVQKSKMGEHGVFLMWLLVDIRWTGNFILQSGEAVFLRLQGHVYKMCFTLITVKQEDDFSLRFVSEKSLQTDKQQRTTSGVY